MRKYTMTRDASRRHIYWYRGYEIRRYTQRFGKSRVTWYTSQDDDFGVYPWNDGHTSTASITCGSQREIMDTIDTVLDSLAGAPT